MTMPSEMQEFVESVNLIGSLGDEESIALLRGRLGPAEFDQALIRAVANCRAFLRTAKTADGIASLSAVSEALLEVEASSGHDDDHRLALAVQRFRLVLSNP